MYPQGGLNPNEDMVYNENMSRTPHIIVGLLIVAMIILGVMVFRSGPATEPPADENIDFEEITEPPTNFDDFDQQGKG